MDLGFSPQTAKLLENVLNDFSPKTITVLEEVMADVPPKTPSVSLISPTPFPKPTSNEAIVELGLGKALRMSMDLVGEASPQVSVMHCN